ncbi:hypothetical protein ACFV27_35310 [Streptomyces antimycoticus]|uniref:Streptomyces killer toxin-like beta/gamma crystallin domain-containing protein n=2 Tax=Streptomyces violaceusniger group TaxID=2839105 RepID=A0ABD5J571_9ACTN|nr:MULTISPECIES: hypothetical protein [Streptomyces]MEE4583120.1 hypothetical protein [Streptomyces sp. DSM 41602]KUL43749.1 hypothetical protein ADL28_42190 [Streptomyces violaceusniger]QTI87988.1 hypothetical protein AS97_44710 [Streptomyces sp. AgN23]RSS38121.1 hypothetical protein EF902_31070 [Streptomyces sp. WAC05858]WJE00929.1 hypothetical protein QR300_36100 [Streptomyces antimycoticus]
MKLVKKLLMVGAAVATTAGLGIIPAEASSSAAAACWTFGNTTSFGTYGGQVCDSSHVMGWAKDTKADGYCVFLRVHYPNGYADGPWACPKNVQKNWDWWAPQGITHVSIEKVYAP